MSMHCRMDNLCSGKDTRTVMNYSTANYLRLTSLPSNKFSQPIWGEMFQGTKGLDFLCCKHEREHTKLENSYLTW